MAWWGNFQPHEEKIWEATCNLISELEKVAFVGKLVDDKYAQATFYYLTVDFEVTYKQSKYMNRAMYSVQMDACSIMMTNLTPIVMADPSLSIMDQKWLHYFGMKILRFLFATMEL